MNLIEFFKKVGNVLKHAFKLVDKLIPDEQMLAGIRFVEQAAEQFVDNGLRRAWVVEQLMKMFHIPESIARLITELAVTQVKNGIEAVTDKVEGAVGQ